MCRYNCHSTFLYDFDIKVTFSGESSNQQHINLVYCHKFYTKHIVVNHWMLVNFFIIGINKECKLQKCLHNSLELDKLIITFPHYSLVSTDRYRLISLPSLVNNSYLL